MASFQFTSPGGKKYTVEGPDGATQEQAFQILQAQLGTAEQAPRSRMDMFKDEALTSLPGGIARGVKDVIDTGAGFLSKLGGSEEAARVQAMNEAGKAEFAGAQERAGAGVSSAARVGGNIIATLPLGGALGAAAKGVGLTRLGNALASGGMTTGAPAATNMLARVADMGVRTAGGAVTGAAAAGLVDPEFALTGGAIGGALPGALKVVGYGGNAIGRVIHGPAQSPELAAVVKSARGAGYVIPPSQARPSLLNRMGEGFAGKLTTAQNASAKNQEVTQKLVARSLGLPEETAITLDALKAVRASAGQTYQNVRGSGVVVADSAFDQAVADIAAKYKTTVPSFPGLGKTGMHGNQIDDIADLVGALKTKSFDSSEAVDAIGILREKADKAFVAGDKTLGKASKDAAVALEDLVGRHLAANGTPEMLSTFQQARQLIAKTYSVEKAMNVSTGTVDARNLAAQLQRGKPLSGELKQAAEFAGRFKKAVQTPEAMGSLPQTSPLDWAFGGVGGTIGSILMGGPGLAGLAMVGSRPLVRSAILSGLVQNRLIQAPSGGALNLLGNPLLQQLGYRSAPVLGANR